MVIYIIIGITIITGGVIFVAWNCFFNWYKEKRMLEAQIFLDSLNNKEWKITNNAESINVKDVKHTQSF